MPVPKLIRITALVWIGQGKGICPSLVADLVKMVILSVPPVTRALIHAVMTVTNGYLPMMLPDQTIDEPNIKNELLDQLVDAYEVGDIQIGMEGSNPDLVIPEFKALTERQALGLFFGCSLILGSENLAWEDVFTIDDEQDTSKHTTDIIDV